MQPSNKPYEDAHEPLDNSSFSRRDWLRQAGLAATLPLMSPWAWADDTAQPDPVQAVVLSYDRFAKKSSSKQTISEATFKEHVKALQDSGATVIKLADLVLHKRTLLAHIPEKAVVITVNGADRGALEVALKELNTLRWPMTMFIEPGKVGKDKSMLTWDELISLHHGERFSMQTTTDPFVDLVKARNGRSAAVLEGIFNERVGKARTTVETRLVKPVSFLSWPFGSQDKDMLALAASAGFLGAVVLGNRPCRRSDAMHAIPRFEMTDNIKGADLAAIINQVWPPKAAQPQS